MESKRHQRDLIKSREKTENRCYIDREIERERKSERETPCDVSVLSDKEGVQDPESLMGEL